MSVFKVSLFMMACMNWWCAVDSAALPTRLEQDGDDIVSVARDILNTNTNGVTWTLVSQLLHSMPVTDRTEDVDSVDPQEPFESPDGVNDIPSSIRSTSEIPSNEMLKAITNDLLQMVPDKIFADESHDPISIDRNSDITDVNDILLRSHVTYWDADDIDQDELDDSNNGTDMPNNSSALVNGTFKSSRNSRFDLSHESHSDGSHAHEHHVNMDDQESENENTSALNVLGVLFNESSAFPHLVEALSHEFPSDEPHAHEHHLNMADQELENKNITTLNEFGVLFNVSSDFSNHVEPLSHEFPSGESQAHENHVNIDDQEFQIGNMSASNEFHALNILDKMSTESNSFSHLIEPLSHESHASHVDVGERNENISVSNESHTLIPSDELSNGSSVLPHHVKPLFHELHSNDPGADEHHVNMGNHELKNENISGLNESQMINEKDELSNVSNAFLQNVEPLLHHVEVSSEDTEPLSQDSEEETAFNILDQLPVKDSELITKSDHMSKLDNETETWTGNNMSHHSNSFVNKFDSLINDSMPLFNDSDSQWTISSIDEELLEDLGLTEANVSELVKESSDINQNNPTTKDKNMVFFDASKENITTNINTSQSASTESTPNQQSLENATLHGNHSPTSKVKSTVTFSTTTNIAFKEAVKNTSNVIGDTINHFEEFEHLVNVTETSVEIKTSKSENETEVPHLVLQCPEPGWCLFSFLALDACSEDSHCLGSRICCKVGCSMTCLEV